MERYIIVYAQERLELQKQVNEHINMGYYPFLPLVIRGESLVQPMILEQDTFMLDIREKQAMFEVGSDV